MALNTSAFEGKTKSTVGSSLNLSAFGGGKPTPVRPDVEDLKASQQKLQKESDFSNSVTGLFVNTIKALPKQTADTGVDLVREIFTKPGARLVLSYNRATSADKPQQLIPETNVEKLLLGDRVIKDFKSEGKDLAVLVGVPEHLAERFSVPLGVAFGVLDFTPPGKALKTLSLSAKQAAKIASSRSVDEIAQEIKTIVNGSDADIKAFSKGLVDIKDATKVQEIISKIAKEQAAVKSAVASVKSKVDGTKEIKVPGLSLKGVADEVTTTGRKTKQVIKQAVADVPAPKISRREDVLLRERIRAQARGAKAGIAGFKREQRVLDQALREIKKEIAKPRARQRSNIAFVKKLGEFNQTVVNEVKRDLGIAKPLAKMNLSELESVTSGIKERLAFKRERGFVPTTASVTEKSTPAPSISDSVYSEAREFVPSKKEGVKKILSNASKGIDVLAGSISTRLANIDPSLKVALRKFEFNSTRARQKNIKQAEPFLNSFSKKKMGNEDYADLDFAFKNGDQSKIQELIKKHGVEEEYKQIKVLLDDMYKEANNVGFDIGYRENYMPRVIGDSEGFLKHLTGREDWSILDEAIKRKEMDLGRALSVEEKGNLVNNMIRGYSGGQITLSKTGAMKTRVIDFIDPQMNQFYQDTPKALISYIDTVTDAVQARKFFGKEMPNNQTIDQFNNIDDSIGAYVTNLMVDKKINPVQEQELRSILQARFNQKGTNGIVGIYKNLTYIDVMGSPFNALTQIGDLAFSIYKSGFVPTAKAAAKSFAGKSTLKKEEIGIEKIAAEMNTDSGMAKAVDTVFRLVGLTKIDSVGKEALINSSLETITKKAIKNPEAVTKELEGIFGVETEALIRDLQNGVISENVKFLAYNTLLDFQPIALSEVPEMYLRAGNGRIFYQLKTWTLKMFDVYRREVFQTMRTDRVQGIQNLVKLSAALIAMNATADMLKDTLLGREINAGDLLVDNIAKLVGFSRYSANQISRDGVGSAITEQILPATAFLDNVSRDVLGAYKDYPESVEVNKLRTIQSVPVGGKLFYWWYGRGIDSPRKASSGDAGIEIPDIEIPGIEVNIPNIEIPNLSI